MSRPCLTLWADRRPSSVSGLACLSYRVSAPSPSSPSSPSARPCFPRGPRASSKVCSVWAPLRVRSRRPSLFLPSAPATARQSPSPSAHPSRSCGKTKVVRDQGAIGRSAFVCATATTGRSVSRPVGGTSRATRRSASRAATPRHASFFTTTCPAMPRRWWISQAGPTPGCRTPSSIARRSPADARAKPRRGRNRSSTGIGPMPPPWPRPWLRATRRRPPRPRSSRGRRSRSSPMAPVPTRASPRVGGMRFRRRPRHQRASRRDRQAPPTSRLPARPRPRHPLQWQLSHRPRRGHLRERFQQRPHEPVRLRRRGRRQRTRPPNLGPRRKRRWPPRAASKAPLWPRGWQAALAGGLRLGQGQLPAAA
jgi:hypothetical protein